MSSRTRSLSLLTAAALLVGAAAPARADEDPRRKEADAIYTDGLRLHDLHKESEALDKFQKAFAIYQSPNILFSIARQEQLLDKPVIAIRHYREAMKSPLLHPTNAALGKQYVAELEARLARVELVGPTGLKVTIINGPVLTLPASDLVDVEPGSVIAKGTLGEARYEGSLVAVGGRVSRLELKPAGGTLATSPPPPPPGGPIGQPPSDDDGQRPRMLTRNLVVGGLEVVAVAGIVVGSVFLSKASSNASDAQPLPSNDPRYASLKDDYSSNRTIGWVGIGVGGGALVGGIAAFLLWPKPSTNGASLTPTFNGFRGSF